MVAATAHISTARQEIAHRLDVLPVSRAHIKALVLAGFGPFFESFDQQNITYVLPAVLASFSLSPSQAGIVAAAANYGMALGCLLAGPLADRYGRKRVFQYFLVWFTVWSGVCAIAWDLSSMAGIRFALGIGLGGELPVGASLIAELLPKSGRRLLPVYQSFFAFGQIAAAGVSLLLAPASPFGWRLVFVVGLVPVLYAAVLRRKLPESPRWLAQQDRLAEARAVLDQFEQTSPIGTRRLPGAPPVASDVLGVEPRPYGYIDLFRGRYARRTLINSLYWIMLWLGTGANALLYVLLSREGFSLQTTLTFGIIATLASAPGYWVSAFLLEKLGRKPTLLLYALAAAAGYYAVVRTVDPAALVITLLVINFCTIGGVGAVYTYLSEQYPTEIRATATSLVNVFSRIALASGAVVVGQLIEIIGPQNAFTLSGASFALAGLILLAFGVETRGKTLEEIQMLVERS